MKKRHKTTFTTILRPFQDFSRMESAGGLVLIAASVLALIIANSPLSGLYLRLLDMPLKVQIGMLEIVKPLLLWINEGLMALFFFLVGMELKREILEGHLSSIRSVSLPAFAALGGMLVPAGIYIALNRGNTTALSGWAIPTSTDIAFALGVLSLLGNRVPTALKTFLLSIAIFDDLGAIILIAILYTAKLSAVSLIMAGLFITGLLCLNKFGVRKVGAYILLGILLWVAVLKSGIHATLAGVVLAMFIPMRTPVKSKKSETSASLLRTLENNLHPWVAFGVLPLFAFANAGLSFTGLSLRDIAHPIPLGIISGLFFGKQIGIVVVSWIAVRLSLASLPDSVNWRQLHATAILCGIGFTMSLFIASLTFENDILQALNRLGILLGTLISGIVGYFALRLVTSSDKAIK